jgi:moderate conductance mechanosensitive channel
MTSSSLASLPALVGSTRPLAATSQPVIEGSGWLYHLLVKLGVSPDTASTVTDLILRPLEILLVVVVAVIVARLGGRAIRHMLERVARQAATRSGSDRAGARVTTMSGVMSNLWRLFVFVVAAAIVLGLFGINLNPLLASATIIGVTLGFGAQQIVRDYFSGVIMTVEDQYNVGDSLTIEGVTGVVEEVTMRLTRFRGVDGTLYTIPNGDIRMNGNLSRGWARAVVDLTLPGGAAADLDRVRQIVGDAARRVEERPEFAGRSTEPPTLVCIESADATTLTVRVMLHTVPSQRAPLTMALREEALVALAREGTWPAAVAS